MSVLHQSAFLNGAGPGWGLGGGADSNQDGASGRALLSGKGQTWTLWECPQGGCPHPPYLHVRPICSGAARAAQAGCPDQGEGGQAGAWGPAGVPGPVARTAVLSHAELSSGRGSGRRAGAGYSLTSSPRGRLPTAGTLGTRPRWL